MNRYNWYYGQYPTEGEMDDMNSRVEEGVGNSIEDTIGKQGLCSVDTLAVEDSPASLDVKVPAGAGWGEETQSIEGGSDNLTVVIGMRWSSEQTIDCSQDKDSVATTPSAGNLRYIACFAKFVRDESGPRTDLDGNPLNYKHDEDYEMEVWAGAEHASSPVRVSTPSGYVLLFEVLLNENVGTTKITDATDLENPGENEIDITNVVYLESVEIKNARNGKRTLKDHLDLLAKLNDVSQNIILNKITAKDIDVIDTDSYIDLTKSGDKSVDIGDSNVKLKTENLEVNTKITTKEIEVVDGTSEYIKKAVEGSQKYLDLGDDDPNGDVIVRIKGDMLVEGSQTVITSEEVEIGTNKFQLNSDVTDDSQNSDAGYEVKRLDDETGTGREVDSLYVPTHGTYPKIIILNTGHGIVAGDYIEITGATNSVNDGTYRIASVSTNELTYDDTYKEVEVDEATSPAVCAKLINAKLLWDESDLRWRCGYDSAFNKIMREGDALFLTSALKSAGYTITNTDGITTVFIDPGATNITITLPDVSQNTGRVLKFVMTTKSTVNSYSKISRAGSAVIKGGYLEGSGGNDYVITGIGDCFEIQSNGTDWWVTNEVINAIKNSRVRVRLSGSQTVTTSSEEILEFDTEDFDKLNEFNTTTHKFEPIIPSGQTWVFDVYLISMVDSVTAAQYSQLRLYKNTTLRLRSSINGTTPWGGTNPPLIDKVEMETGDTLEGRFFHTHGSDRNVSDGVSTVFVISRRS